MFHKKAWNIQFTQRSLAIETHLLTARFPQRSLSQSYQKRFAQNIPPIRSSQNKLSSPSEAFLCTCTAASLYTNSGIHTKSHIESHVPLPTAASPHRQQDNQHFVTKNWDHSYNFPYQPYVPAWNIPAKTNFPPSAKPFSVHSEKPRY